MILRQKLVTNFIPGTETQIWMQLSRQNVGSRLFMAIDKQNNRHTAPPKTNSIRHDTSKGYWSLPQKCNKEQSG